MKTETEVKNEARILTRVNILKEISDELDRAYAKHGEDKWGHHEFYGILLEEVDEVWEAIRCDAEEEHVRREAIQVAAMVFRYLETGNRYAKEP